MSKRTPLRWIIIPFGILLLLALAPQWLHATGPEQDELQTIWQRVRRAGAYEFSADLTQTFMPLPTVKNAGRESKEHRVYLEGETDPAAESLLLTMWSGGGSVLLPETGLQVKVQEGTAHARQGAQPWAPIDDFSGMFAPGGDFMAYLAAADNVVRGDPERRSTALGEISFVRYSFDVNGRRFAEYMREQMTQQLTATGELPPVVQVGVSKVYAGMSGRGELWVGENGMPIHQAFDLQFPDRADDHAVTAHVEVDFSNFQSVPDVATAANPDLALRAFAGFASTAKGTAQGGVAWLLAGLGLASVALIIIRRRSPHVYAGVSLAVIFSMVITPLVTGHQVSAFSSRQLEQQLEAEARQTQQANQDKMRADLLSTDFSPNADPLVKVRAEQALLVASATSTTTTTSGEYGLSACTSTPNADDDGDGLSNLEECLLGTSPSLADTDQDLLDDHTEVNGVSLVDNDNNTRVWYTDPNSADSNLDGISDGKEWLLDVNGDNLPDDTDDDGTPDIWDRDNDGDGVPDNLDLSPHYSTMGEKTFSGDDPFQLIVDDLGKGELTRVEFQLSPTNVDHLWYTLNVLNWPDDDRQGQIQDADGKTFFDVDNSLSISPNDNGDVRMIPMLEIEITGTPDNLPADDVLNQFGISVQQTSSNVQTAYIPLQLVTDTTGDKNVAFHGRMIYNPDSSWGNAQQVRLVWMVQALVDSCSEYKNNICSEYSEYNKTQIIQVYDDEWFLTGLHVKEEHDTDVAIIYEDPSVASGDEPFYMSALYGLLYGLERSFLAGRTSDGGRDMTVSEIATRFDHATNSAISDEERWQLPNVLSVKTASYETEELAMQSTTVTETVSVLDDVFTPAWSASSAITPTIMYAWEQSYRSLNLDESISDTVNLSWSGNSLTVDLPTGGADAVQTETSVAVKWTPYSYDSASGWSDYGIESFWDEMTDLLSNDFSGISDENEADTYQGLAQLLYLTVYSGLNSVVQQGDYTLTADYETSDKPIGAKIATDLASLLKKVMRSTITYGSEFEVVRELLETEQGEVSSFDVASTWAGLKLQEWFGDTFGSVKAVAGIVLLVAAAGLLAWRQIAGNNSASSGVSIATAAVVGAIMSYFSIIRPIMKVWKLTQALMEIDEDIGPAEALFSSLTSSLELVNQSKAIGVFGLIISIVLSVAIFIYVVASGQVSAGSIAFNELLAETIGAIIMAVVLFVISLSVIGSILVGIVAVVDIILTILGLGSDTVTAKVTEAIASILYQFDLTTTQDIENGTIGLQLTDQSQGLIAGNHIIYSLPLTTTLQQTVPLSKSALRDNSFEFELNEFDAAVTDFTTATGDRSADWTVTQFDTYTEEDPESGISTSSPLYQAVVSDDPSAKIVLSAGVNADTTIYLNTAYALDGESCWVGFCSSKSVSGNNSTEIGSSVKLDVLPATLDEFVNVSSWSNGELSIADADGDGLLPIALGGLDHDDSTWDTDGDNLSDAYEQTMRARSQAEGGKDLDPLIADTDSDSIQDDKELRLTTNPGNADSDGDGLNDVEEIPPFGGWLISYGITATTRIWSNPLNKDSDSDGMTDLFERTQDTCPDCDPWADPDNPNVYNPNVWNENAVALYVSDDTSGGFVLPTSAFAYTTTTVNNLSDDMTLAGNLTLELPDGLSGSPLSTSVNVSSGFTETLVSTLTPDTSASKSIVLTSTLKVTEYDASSWGWDSQVAETITGSVGNASAVASASAHGWDEGYVVATTLETASDGTESIVAYLLNPDGSVNGNQTLTSSNDTISLTVPNIACNDDGVCLVTWGSYDSSDKTAQVMAARLHKSLSNPSAVTVATQDGGNKISPVAVASDGTDFMAAWGKPAAGNAEELWVRPVTSAGQVTEPVQQIPDAISGQGNIPPYVSLVWGGDPFSGYVAAWADLGYSWYATVNTTGAAGQRSKISGGNGIVSLGNWTAPKLAADPISQQVLVVYTTGSLLSGVKLLARRLFATGVSEEIVLDTSDTVQVNSLAVTAVTDAKNGGWIVSWANPWDSILSTDSVQLASTHYQAISPAGTLRQSEQLFTTSIQGTPAPGVAMACTQSIPKLALNFEESAGATTFADDSDQGNDASCASNSTCPLSGESGRYGNGVFFDGVDAYLDTDASVVELGQGDFTIGVWVKTDVDSATQDIAIMTKNDGDTSWEKGEKSFYLDGSGQPSFVGWGNNYIHSTVAVNDGFWHHVVAVWDFNGSGTEGVARMYVDGINATANSTNYVANNNDNVGDTLKIARPNYGEAPNYFSGNMDSIVVYDRALSAAEIRDAFDAAIAIFDLDEVDGSATFIDSSNSSFDATCSDGHCPTMGVDGVAYTAAQFNGTGDVLEIQTSKRTVEIFSYDFESETGSGWDKTDTHSATTAAGSTTFLGTFGNETVKLDLSNLPTHDTIEVSFDLFLPGTWDGDRTDLGPDNWEWGADSSRIFKSNFSNQSDSAGNYQYAPANWYSGSDNGWWTNEIYGLTVYRDSGCTGISQTFTADAPDLSNEPIGNDTISCYGYSKNYDVTVATLYKDTNYEGTAWVSDIKRGVLPSYESDAISSIRVWPAAHAPKHGAKDDSLSISGSSKGTIYSFSNTISNHTSDTLSLYFKGDTSSSNSEQWGLDNVVVTVKSDHGSVPLTNSSFTLSAWAKRNTTDADWILGQGSSGDNTALHFGFRDSSGFYCGFSSDFSNSLNASLGYHTDWRHYACTYDAATNTRTLYENGVKVAGDTASDDYSGVGSTLIGTLPFDTSSYFSGDIDEVAMWTEALSADDILELYEKVKVEDESMLRCLLARTADADTFSVHELALRETTTALGVDTQSITHTIGIDADSPTTTILAPSAGYVGGDSGLSVSGTAVDPTSYVEKVEVQLNDGAWQTADGTETWSTVWNATDLEEGSLTVRARATDLLGHLGGTASLPYILDLTPPSVSLVTPGDQVRPTRDSRGRWLVPMSGNISDPGAGNQMGSGVASAEILLQGSQALAGNGWQKASIHTDGSSWSLDYRLPAHLGAGQGIAVPSGVYTATLRATDTVNNTTAEADYVTAITTVDATAPVLSQASPDNTTSLITTTLILSGLVTDTNQISAVEINFTPAEQIAALNGAVLHLPFDETQNTEYWADQSGTNHPAACSPSLNCPEVNNTTGQRDRAVFYTGTSELSVSGIDLANNSFTLAAWARRWLTGEWRILMSQGTATTDQGLHFGYGPSDVFTCAFWGDDLSTADSYTDNDWHHWACTYDAGTNTRTIYLDGVQVAQDTATEDFQGSGVFHVGKHIDGSTYAGALDEVTVHKRALADYEVADLYAYGFGAWKTASLSDDTNPTWTYTIPDGADGLEGIYQINVRGTDALGNATTLQGQRTWRGEIDTRPPDVTFTAKQETIGLGVPSGTKYTCTASDFSLDEDATCKPVGSSIYPDFKITDFAETTYASTNEWYAKTISDTTRLYEIKANRTDAPFLPTSLSVKTCDVYDHCTTTSSNAVSTGGKQTLAATETATPVADTLIAGIITPSAGTVLSSTTPIRVSGFAYALDALHTLTVTVNSEPAHTQNWVTNTITNTLWDFQWTPPGQGKYLLQPIVGDWHGPIPPDLTPQAYLPLVSAHTTLDDVHRISPTSEPEHHSTSPATVPAGIINLTGIYTGAVSTTYIDVEPPTIDIEPDILTMEDQLGANTVRLSGTVSDSLALHRVEVSVDGGSWQRASFGDDGRWQIPLKLPGVLDGKTFGIRAKATDKAGWETTTAETITVDIVPPDPAPITLAYVNAQGVTLPTAAQSTLSDAISLDMTWTASSDGSGIADYLVGWSQMPTINPDELTPYTGPGTHSQTVGEAQSWYGHVQMIDGVGNIRSQTVDPLYVDGPYTPDLVDDLRYQGWANEVCAIEGVDRRLAQTHPDAAGNALQRFYVSWDTDALRVSWHGANWNHDGDLFLYLDTRPGGTDRLFNPYPENQATIVYLPGNTSDPQATVSDRGVMAQTSLGISSTQSAAMGADLMVWVEDGGLATLYRWIDAAWQSEGRLDDNNFSFTPGTEMSLSDILLPFSLMNIADPGSAALGLLAVATEEESLQLWATMPVRNPMNSERVVNPIAAQTNEHNFPLVRSYFWDALGKGICPNGRLNEDLSGPTGGSFADSDLQFTLSADPVGTSYSFMNDEMAWLWTMLFGFEKVPIVPSLVFDHLDTNHPPLGPGQTITFTIDYVNQGTEAATGVQIELGSWFSLALPDQIIELGDIPAGASGKTTITAQIDVSGVAPALQEWAALDAFVYDDQSPRNATGGPWSSAPLEWMWSDHAVDITAPSEVAIKSPFAVIGAEELVIRGHAFDESAIPLINLEVRKSDNTSQVFQCPDATPHNASWQCTWNPGSVTDGDTFALRAQAVDRFGQASGWTEWVTLVADVTPPNVTVNPGVAGQIIGPGVHTLSGSISDNIGIAAVRICRSDDDCATAPVKPSSIARQLYTEGTWTYNLPSPGTSDVDDLEQTLAVHGVDAVGNISPDPVIVSYRLDFTPPKLNVTNAVEQISGLSSDPVLQGTASDGSAFNVYARVSPPTGADYQAKTSVAGGTWSYTPYWSEIGDYIVWIRAIDSVGNTTKIGPYNISVSTTAD